MRNLALATEPAKAAAAAERTSPRQCTAAGPLACQLAPVDSLAGACAQLRECLSGSTRGKDNALQITSCKAHYTIGAGALRQASRQRAEAPASPADQPTD